MLEAVFAKWAAPGMCNPDDEDPVHGWRTARPRTVSGDTRSTGQRNHDALKAMGRAMLASGQLGQPQRAAGDAGHLHHTQRAGIRHRACGHRRGQPAADVGGDPPSRGGPALPGGVRQPHRPTAVPRPQPNDWPPRHNGSCCMPTTAAARSPAAPHRPITARSTTRRPTGPTADTPTSTTKPWPAARDNRRVKPGGWSTRKRKDGRTEWIPPPHLDTGQARVNNYHHPERYLIPDERPHDEDEGDDDGH